MIQEEILKKLLLKELIEHNGLLIPKYSEITEMILFPYFKSQIYKSGTIWIVVKPISKEDNSKHLKYFENCVISIDKSTDGNAAYTVKQTQMNNFYPLGYYITATPWC